MILRLFVELVEKKQQECKVKYKISNKKGNHRKVVPFLCGRIA